MSGPQFMHIETYPIEVSKLRKKREAERAEKGEVIDRKLNVEEICGEAARLPGHCPHVDEAKAPVLLYGIFPDQLPALLKERVAVANEKIKAIKAAMPRGTRKDGPRAVRPDTHTLLTFVASHPIPWHHSETGEAFFDIPENRALLEKWEELNIAWAKAKADELGFELVSVVRHEDESHPHLHILGIPRNLRMDARGCHPGYVARDALEQQEGEDEKSFKRRRNRTYNTAMRALQDDYYELVGLDAGLLRTGPKRQRLTTGAYKQEKAAGRARGLASVRAAQLSEENEQKQKELADTEDLLALTQGETVEAIIRASDLEREHAGLEADLVAKRAEADWLESLQVRGRALPGEIEAAEAALTRVQQQRLEEEATLQAMRQERLEAEAVLTQTRAETERIQTELERDQRQLSDDKRQFDEKKKTHEREIADQRETLAKTQRELDALVEGIEAYADGKLLFRANEQANPLALKPGRDGIDVGLRDRLIPVKPRLIPILSKIDTAVSRRAEKLGDTLKAAIEGWAAGLIRARGGQGNDGRPDIDVDETDDGKNLLAKIGPFREAVARVIAVLPDQKLIRSVTSTLSRLRPRLSVAEQEEAQEYELGVAALEQQRRHAGRG